MVGGSVRASLQDALFQINKNPGLKSGAVNLDAFSILSKARFMGKDQS